MTLFPLSDVYARTRIRSIGINPSLRDMDERAHRARLKVNPQTIGFVFQMRLGGRCQRGVRYALWALGEASTRQILEYCYYWPAETRLQRLHRARAVRRAAERIAVRVGRTWPHGCLWKLRAVNHPTVIIEITGEISPGTILPISAAILGAKKAPPGRG